MPPIASQTIDQLQPLQFVVEADAVGMPRASLGSNWWRGRREPCSIRSVVVSSGAPAGNRAPVPTG